MPSDYGACMSESHTYWHRFNIATDSGWGKGMLSNTVCPSWAGIILLLSIRRQSSRTCSLFWTLNHYCPYEILIASQSRFSREIEEWSYVSIFLGGGGVESHSENFQQFPAKKWRVLFKFGVRTLFKCGD